ncbi:crossover junction endodeoxyribonuclease RuvC [Alphaproteobacteria bacterium]|nr:crossover junction endodeoxyribonuclease RuvC [Alphaproteobacteria bacterium]
MRIIGIDPGLRNTGWGIIEFQNNKLIYIGDGSISPSPNLSDGERLLHIKNKITEITLEHAPTISAIEQIFVGSGTGSSLKLGMARGVSMLALAEAGLIIKELTPKFVKKTVTGYGAASKQQLKSMVEKLLNVVPRNEDSSDALAIAISAQHIGYKNVTSDLLEENNGLNLAIAKALLKEKNIQ